MKLACFLCLFAMVAVGVEAEDDSNPRVALETSKGRIVLELDAVKAPGTVSNFLAYVDEEFYDGTIFHRVIPNFMNQGGGFTADMQQKATRATIQNEADNGLRNDIGTVAMARKPDPHSASAQFFINTGNNDFLNHTARDARGWGYAVFGKVVEGMDVAQAISGVKTGRKNGMSDVPVDPVLILSARRETATAAE